MKRDDLLRLRDQIFTSLLVREGQTLDNATATERANNIAVWLEAEVDALVKAALVEAARGYVVTGNIDKGDGK